MASHFTAEIRILLCEGCGAPLQVPLDAGQIPCTYCRVANIVVLRDERPTLGMPQAPTPIDENERMRRLRLQDGKPLLTPPALASLVPGGHIEVWREQEVFAVYQSTRKEVRSTHSPDAAERLYFLTLVISNHLSTANQPERLRAILETALDTLTLPRHRQVLRGLLARHAVRENDLVAAERWLGPCDSRSDDLDSDSAYRVSRALIDTAKRDFAAVLEVLGPTENTIPVMDAMDASASVLRANALEKRGDIAGAVRVLTERMTSGPAGREAIEAVAAQSPSLALCAQSLPQAAATFTETASQAAGSGTRVFGILFMAIGIVVLGIGLTVAAVLIGGGLFASSENEALGFVLIPGLLGGVLGGCGGPSIAGLAMFGVGYLAYRSGKRATEIRRSSVAAMAVVRAIQPTGMRLNEVPVFVLKLQIERPGAAPYDAEVRRTMYGHEITVGSRIAVRVNPAKPSEVLIETR